MSISNRLSVSYSKKNIDVRNIVDEWSDKNLNISENVSDAIRLYHKLTEFIDRENLNPNDIIQAINFTKENKNKSTIDGKVTITKENFYDFTFNPDAIKLLLDLILPSAANVISSVISTNNLTVNTSGFNTAPIMEVKEEITEEIIEENNIDNKELDDTIVQENIKEETKEEEEEEEEEDYDDYDDYDDSELFGIPDEVADGMDSMGPIDPPSE